MKGMIGKAEDGKTIKEFIEKAKEDTNLAVIMRGRVDKPSPNHGYT